jgi:hypothetical protein
MNAVVRFGREFAAIGRATKPLEIVAEALLVVTVGVPGFDIVNGYR